MNIKKNDMLNMTITGSIIEDQDPTIFNLADGAMIKMIPNPAPTKE